MSEVFTVSPSLITFPKTSTIASFLRAWDGTPLPAPWSAEETDACCIVRDANRQALAYVYFEGELDHRSAAHLDEARRIAANIAKLPEMLPKPK